MPRGKFLSQIHGLSRPYFTDEEAEAEKLASAAELSLCPLTPGHHT